MRIIDDVKLDFDDVLILPKRSTLESRKDVDLQRTFKFKHSKQTFVGVPIMASNMDTVGNIATARILANANMFTCLSKFIISHDEYDNIKDFCKKHKSNYAWTIGLREDLENQFLQEANYLCLDVANGYTETFVDFVKTVREKFPKKTLIAGNVCTPEMTEELILAGADVIKVGIGPGGQCLTRTQTGVGMPQLSAIIECADAAHGLKGHIVADGGCRTPGDIAKAFAANADFVMLGSMLAAHDENAEFDADGFTLVYGMSSTQAMFTHYGKVDPHRTTEGRVSQLKSRGSLHDTINNILGGIRSTCTYVGASSLKELSKRTTFVKTNRVINREYESHTIGN